MNNVTINSADSAFADDTIWIGSSQTNLQNIISLSDSFFQLNDMDINGDKSELIYIGPKKNKEQTSITMGKNKAIIYSPANKTPVRYLGCWFKRQKGHAHIINKAMNIIKENCKLLKYKQITAAQISYINNDIIIP